MIPKRKPKPTGRKRGGQPGNTNRLVHGAYSRHISVEIEHGLDSMPEDQNNNELALARSRLLACMDKQQAASPGEWLSFEYAIQKYLHDISRLTHTNAILGKDRKSALITVMDMIRQVNDQQHVR